MEISNTNRGDADPKQQEKVCKEHEMFYAFSIFLLDLLFFGFFLGFMHIGYMWVVHLESTSTHLVDKAEQGKNIVISWSFSFLGVIIKSQLRKDEKEKCAPAL